MDMASLIRTLGGLGVVLGVLAGALWIVRRYDLRLPGRAVSALDRRLELVETLSIDARRTVALVRRDGREHVILIAPEGHVVLESAVERDPADLAAVEARDSARAEASAEREQQRAWRRELRVSAQKDQYARLWAMVRRVGVRVAAGIDAAFVIAAKDMATIASRSRSGPRTYAAAATNLARRAHKFARRAHSLARHAHHRTRMRALPVLRALQLEVDRLFAALLTIRSVARHRLWPPPPDRPRARDPACQAVAPPRPALARTSAPHAATAYVRPNTKRARRRRRALQEKRVA